MFSGSNNMSPTHFLELGHRIAAISNEKREGILLLRRLSILLQRFNAILLRDSFATSDAPDLWSFQQFLDPETRLLALRTFFLLLSDFRCDKALCCLNLNRS